MKTFDNSEFENYKKEVQEKWESTDAYKEYAQKTKSYGKDQWSAIISGLELIFKEFAICMKNGIKSDAEEAQSLVRKLQSYITENYYTCTQEILSGLGQMYVVDERFKNNIDKHAEGTAAYVREAIACYGK